MDLEKLTDRARGFLQAAQTIAVRENHQRITPAHYAKALLDDEQGMAVGLINAAGGDGAAARREIDALVAKQPAVTGSGATQAPGIDGDLIRLLDRAQGATRQPRPTRAGESPSRCPPDRWLGLDRRFASWWSQSPRRLSRRRSSALCSSAPCHPARGRSYR